MYTLGKSFNIIRHICANSGGVPSSLHFISLLSQNNLLDLTPYVNENYDKNHVNFSIQNRDLQISSNQYVSTSPEIVKHIERHQSNKSQVAGREFEQTLPILYTTLRMLVLICWFISVSLPINMCYLLQCYYGYRIVTRHKCKDQLAM